MSKELQVLLLEQIRGVGEVGQVVTVSEGYARNFLFPGGKAALATGEVQVKARQAASAKKAKEEQNILELQQLAETLEGSELVFTARAQEGKGIFGSIGKKEIASRLKQEVHLNVAPKDVLLEEPLKEMGSTNVTIKLSPQIESTIRITIVSKLEIAKEE